MTSDEINAHSLLLVPYDRDMVDGARNCFSSFHQCHRAMRAFTVEGDVILAFGACRAKYV